MHKDEPTHSVTDAFMSPKLIDPECGENKGYACRIFWLTALPLKSPFKEHSVPYLIIAGG